ncbi:complex III assembly factor LYRM7-like isoform X2 [Acropora millepora]|uniref:complex III assembly factor LYRM7-like isoform X2 n=1 Tax=Acropora millepora TaxID=45264 RepID=UPI001CF2E183|nr:complex III assembly factor LYRM7-like isoform X2 [Acropora millepora]
MISHEVLSCYRSLHRTRLKVFEGDKQALEAGKLRIQNEFAKHKNEADPSRILELIAAAESAEKFLRCNVVQGVQTERGTYRLKITKDTELQTNALPPRKKNS